MEHKRITYKEAAKLIEDSETAFFGIRGDNFIPAEGFNNSSYHGDDELEFELGGVSALAIDWYNSPDAHDVEKIAKKARAYGKNVFLLKGKASKNDSGYCDPGEILFAEHEILGIIEIID